MTRVSSCIAMAAVAILGAWQPQPRGRLEDAYRASNLGVARLEQFDFDAAAASFREALAIEPSLGTARVNLAIALLYSGQLDAARTAAEAAATALPDRRSPYVLGSSRRRLTMRSPRSGGCCASIRRTPGPR
jgi:Tfp pilus assembly protein PilF